MVPSWKEVQQRYDQDCGYTDDQSVPNVVIDGG